MPLVTLRTKHAGVAPRKDMEFLALELRCIVELNGKPGW